MILFNSEYLVACIPWDLSTFLNMKVEVKTRVKHLGYGLQDADFLLIYTSKCLIFTVSVLVKVLNSLSCG